MNTTRKPIEERLAAKLRPAENGCVHFTGALVNGYGYIGRGGKHGGATYAHRVAWEAVHGPIPPELQIEHACHTNDKTCPGGPECLHRRCCNVEHLELLTHLENVHRTRCSGWPARRARLARQEIA